VPELAVEVISPNDRDRDIQEKLEQDFAHGARRVWHVRTSTRKVYDYASPTEVTILGEGDVLDAGPLLPGLRIEVGPLFRRTVG
jgi:Uma2 family endonuclease